MRRPRNQKLMTRPDLSPEDTFDHASIEARARELWEREAIYLFNQGGDAPIFSVDTPPPYVSAAHLHVGHAMSYSQAEFIVRYKRMRGFNVFYPMGFDDNGLPTERYVEQTYKVNKKTISRVDFRELCIAETQRGAKTYEEMWRSLGLSVDWRLRYSTIDHHSRRTAQKSFIELYRKGLVYRSADPVLWDTVYDTALAQADLETVSRKSTLYDITFHATDGIGLVIATARPELLPACVALFYHPNDPRYKSLANQRARVPLFDYDVPIYTSDQVDPEFGSGLMMVCTFGDGEDVQKWREYGLNTRIVIGRDGKLTDVAGPYAGLDVASARKAIVRDLEGIGLLLNQKRIEQNVSVGERSGQPVEFAMTPQWFIRVLDLKDIFIKRSHELAWFPEYMEARLEQWIRGLKYDWNISRQRFYGVPFPIWYVQETGDVILADEKDLPVDPTDDTPPKWALEKYAKMNIVPETDVMDTWMTSSLTPQINTNWAGSPDRVELPLNAYPMSLRVQAFEIIRTWLFYTLVKAHHHSNSVPWHRVMISGWGLNEQGKKISKRDLEQFTDESGYNRYDPHAVIRKYGADALRYWAAGNHLGHDLRYHEKDVRVGRKLVIKLWNVARLVEVYSEGDRELSVPMRERPIEDRWVLLNGARLICDVTKHFDAFDYALARDALDRYFWNILCDNYIEIIKDRLRKPEVFGEKSRRAAQETLRETLRMLIGLFAPFVPFITEEIYQRFFAAEESIVSLHKTSWPRSGAEVEGLEETHEMSAILALLDAWRFVRSRERLPSSVEIDEIAMKIGSESSIRQEVLRGHQDTLRTALRSRRVVFTEERGMPTNQVGLELSFRISE